MRSAGESLAKVCFYHHSPAAVLVLAGTSVPAAAASAPAPVRTSATHARAARPAPPVTATNSPGVAGVTRIKLAAAAQQQLLRLYVAFRHVRAGNVAETLPGSVRAARITASGQEWAVASFVPSVQAPASVATGFQDGGGTGIYTRSLRGMWRMAGLGGEPTGCAEHLPAAVRKLCGLAGCGGPSGQPSPRGGLAKGNPGNTAFSYLGVGDTPSSTDLSTETADCNPFTALVSTTGGSGSPAPCGTDPTFNIRDKAEFWCSDFAEYVWEKSGIPGTSPLSASSSSFYTYGHNYGESMPTDPASLPAPGDAVVFYPGGVTPSGSPGAADHVGIVYSVDASAGTIDLINGDWGGGSNISVKEAKNITLSTASSSWPQQQWGHTEEWIYVAPAAAVSADSAWDNEFQSYGDTSGAWSGGDGAQSVVLPNGNTKWFFADTYLGQTDSDGTRPPMSTGIAHNSAVLYNANTGALGPTSAVGPGSGGYFFLGDYTWVTPPSGYPADQYELINGDQVVDGGKVYKFFQLADRFINPGGFAYKLVGTVLESFSISGNTLTPQGGTPIGVQDTSGSNPIIWGTGVLVSGGYIYIYGTEPYNASAGSNHAYPLFLARVPVGGLAAGDAWQYYAAGPSCSPGSGAWSSNAGNASPLMPGGTSSGFSVTDVNGTDVLLTNDSTGTYNDAVAYYSDCPTGFSASSPKYQNMAFQIAVCNNQVAPNQYCGYNLDWGNTSTTVTSLIPGDTYEIQLETCLAVPQQGYVGSNVLTVVAT